MALTLGPVIGTLGRRSQTITVGTTEVTATLGAGDWIIAADIAVTGDRIFINGSVSPYNALYWVRVSGPGTVRLKRGFGSGPFYIAPID